jgi:hypothetical protein
MAVYFEEDPSQRRLVNRFLGSDAKAVAQTIADLRVEGVRGAPVWCLNHAYQHYGVVPVERIGARSSFMFIDLPKMRETAACGWAS